MLKKLRNNSVQGEGFTVTVPNIHEVLYEDVDGAYGVEIEGGNMGGSASPDWLIYSQTLSRKGASNTDPLPSKKQGEILRCISQSLTALGMSHEII